MSRTKLQQKVDDAINKGDTWAGVVYNAIMALLVLTVCVDFVIQTYPIPAATARILGTVDLVITVLFLIDYIIRWWAKQFDPRYPFTIMAIIDFIAILPLFIPQRSWQFVRVLRFGRMYVVNDDTSQNAESRRVDAELHLGRVCRPRVRPCGGT